MKHALPLLTLALSPLLSSCVTTAPEATAELSRLPPNHPVRSEQHLLEILHHVFLWHYDRSYLLSDQKQEDVQIYIRGLPRVLDEQDRSEFAELWIPNVNMAIELKRADYRIEELDLPVKDDQFKVRRVIRSDHPPAPLSTYECQLMTRARLRAWFTNNIHVAAPLSPTLFARLREAVIDHHFRQEPDTSVAHFFHVAPISPASDELWVFHENANQLLLFSSDMDFSNEAYWGIAPIHLKIYDLDPRVILAPETAAAGTAQLSKDFVGRALFNCVVLGERIELSPEAMREILREKARRESESP